jgi:hypothetical protein
MLLCIRSTDWSHKIPGGARPVYILRKKRRPPVMQGVSNAIRLKRALHYAAKP